MDNKKKILSVDDNPLNNEIITEVLGDDYNVRCVLTGEDALEVALDFKPDLILLDIMLPGIDGYEVCRRICSDERLKDTTIIIVSAKGLLEEMVEGYNAGAYDYITKPYTEDNLRKTVEYFTRSEDMKKLKLQMNGF